MRLRSIALAMTLLLVPGMAFAETDIDAVCYDDCEAATHSNPDYKACPRGRQGRCRAEPGL